MGELAVTVDAVNPSLIYLEGDGPLVFSPYKRKDQTSIQRAFNNALEDYIETSIMLQFRKT